jgi:ferredoxin
VTARVRAERTASATTGRRLRVDPVACDGIGMCAMVAPGLVELNSWGYPAAAGGPLTGRALRRAAAAVTACPRRALLLEDRHGADAATQTTEE